MRRRILLTGGSGALSTTAPVDAVVVVAAVAFAAAGFGATFGVALATAGVGVEVDWAAPSATRAPGGVADETSPSVS